jgi:hypothetical protein
MESCNKAGSMTLNPNATSITHRAAQAEDQHTSAQDRKAMFVSRIPRVRGLDAKREPRHAWLYIAFQLSEDTDQTRKTPETSPRTESMFHFATLSSEFFLQKSSLVL